MVTALRADQHQAHRQWPSPRQRQGNAAAVKHIELGAVAQDKRIGFGETLKVSQQGRDQRRSYSSRWHYQRVKGRKGLARHCHGDGPLRQHTGKAGAGNFRVRANAPDNKGINSLRAGTEHTGVNISRLNSGDRAFRINAINAAQMRFKVKIRQRRASCRQLRQRTLKSCGHRRVKIVQHPPARHAKPHAAQRARGQRPRRLARQHAVRQRRIAHSARQRADTVERGGQRHGARAGNARLGRLEADKAVERRRDAYRAAGVRANGNLAHAVRATDSRAAGRAAGDACAVHHAARRAKMMIDADTGKSQFRHVGFANNHRAALTQPPHDCRVLAFGRRSLVNEAAGRRWLTCHTEQILDRHNPSVQRSQRYPIARPRIGRVSCGARRFRIEFGETPRALACGVGNAA